MATKKNTEAVMENNAPMAPTPGPEVYVTPQMSQAINILIQGVEMGQKAGVYSFADAGLIGQAIDVLNQYRPK